ncbi:hypothetical protein [Hymenobacter ruber]
MSPLLITVPLLAAGRAQAQFLSLKELLLAKKANQEHSIHGGGTQTIGGRKDAAERRICGRAVAVRRPELSRVLNEESAP